MRTAVQRPPPPPPPPPPPENPPPPPPEELPGGVEADAICELRLLPIALVRLDRLSLPTPWYQAMPAVAVAAITVALLWAVRGEEYRRAAIGFGLAFAAVTGLIFFATTPGTLWGRVTCDTLSVGFFALAAVGGVLLAGSAAVLTGRGLPFEVDGHLPVLPGVEGGAWLIDDEARTPNASRGP